IALVDSLPAGLTFLSATPANTSAGPGWTTALAPGASAVFYVNATVNQGVVSASTPTSVLTNCVNALGVPPNGNNVSSSSCAGVTVYYANISVLKLDQTLLQPSPGGTVQFNLTVTNTGNVTLNP